MLHALSLVTFGLAVAGTYAAVMRDVPILNAFNRPATSTGPYAAQIVCATFLASLALDYFGVTLSG